MRRHFMAGLAVVLAAGWIRAEPPATLPSAPAAGAVLSGIAPEAPEPADSRPVVQDRPVGPDNDGGDSGDLWIDAGYFMGWVRGDHLPALVTTSPAGTPQAQAGVLGQATTVLYGNNEVNGDFRSGGQFQAGLWLDQAHTLALDGDFFFLQSVTAHFNAASTGNPILARPILNAATGLQDAVLVAFPGLATGSIAVADQSGEFVGAGLGMREVICSGTWYRLDTTFGYRYLRLADGLTVAESMVSQAANSTIPVGTSFLITDQFRTHNVFNGGAIGLAGEARGGNLFLDWHVQADVGQSDASLDVAGSRTVTEPGGTANVQPGGLLALSSNSGHFSKNRVEVLPEAGVKLGFQVTSRLRVFAGYNLLEWWHVYRPGNQIDTTVNPNLFPPVTSPVTGPNNPQPKQASTNVWVQGIDLGLEYCF